jgi:hypothetical protein
VKLSLSLSLSLSLPNNYSDLYYPTTKKLPSCKPNNTQEPEEEAEKGLTSFVEFWKCLVGGHLRIYIQIFLMSCMM